MKKIIILLSILLIIISGCDRHKYSDIDQIVIIDISEPCVEKHAKRGIEISKEEHEEIVNSNILK